MIAQIRHVLPLTTIHRERILPIPGKVLVRKGQRVSTTDTVAETRLTPEHLLLDVARGLKLFGDRADKVIQCRPGDKVAEGDVLAGPAGLTKRTIRSPRNGRVILTGGGQILIEVENPPFELRAGYPGTVTELLDDEGAIIEATGALIQGVWGNGRIDFGLLFVLAHAPDEVLQSSQLDVSLRGSIALAGHCQNAEFLKAAGELPLRGLILSSMDVSVVPVALKMRYPIVLIEGFGHIPMNSAAYKLLSTNGQREVAINAEQWNPLTGVRPEIFIPLPAADVLPLPPDTDEFSAGQQVHVFRAPYAGKIGKIVELLPGMSALTNGLSTQAALVEMETGDTVLIPLANLEVLE